MLRVRLFGAGILALAIVGLTASQLLAADESENKAPERPARGDFMQHSGSGLELLEAKVVADDLNLTDEQKESIKKLSEDTRAKMHEMRSSLQGASREEIGQKMADARKELDKKIDGVLDAKQQARFKEIKLQQVGAFALAQDPVQDALKVNEDQEASIKKIMDQFEKDAHSARPEAGASATAADRAAARQKMQELAKDAKDKLLAVLTSDQRDQFDKMQGKKLDLSSVHFGSRGGFGRRQRNADSNSENKSENKSDSKSDSK